MIHLATETVVRADFGASIAIALVMAALSMVLSELLKPKPNIENARPAGLGDFKFPTAEEGRSVPLLVGTCDQKGPNVIWYGDLRQEAQTKNVKTGLFSKKSYVTGFKYYVGIQFGICLGKVDALKRIWIGDVEVWSGTAVGGDTININEPNLFGGDDLGNGGVVGTLRFHDGDPTQAVNSYLSAHQTPTPAYRHLAHCVWEGGYIGNSEQIKPWRFEVERLPNTLALTGNKHKVNSVDSNPSCLMYEAMTDTRWGLGFPASDVNTSSFQTAGDSFYTEGNGYSMLITSPMGAGEYIRELERQTDSVIYLNRQTGKWEVNLARDGYDVDTIPQITDDDILELKDWNPGTWDQVPNEIRVGFDDRARDYFSTFAMAPNPAGQQIRGRVDPVSMKFPGIKDRTLANSIASREIRSLSRPVGKATVTLTREFWDLHPGDVIAWTHAELGLAKIPMRVNKINLGTLVDGKIEIGLTEDVYSHKAGYMGDTQDPGWALPTQDMAQIPTDEQLVEEAPWAIARRDIDFPGISDRIFATARTQGGAISFRMYERNSSGTPSGAYSLAGEGYGFLLIGQLGAAIAKEDANPEAGGAGSPRIEADDDTLAAISAALGSASSGDVGQNLVHLCKIDDEYIAFESFTDQTTYLQLNEVYRGMLDTIPADHAANAKVYILHAGATISDSTIPQTNNVDVQLRARSQTDESTEGESVTKAITMDNRVRRPYPPVELFVNGTRFHTAPDFDTMKSGGTTLDDRGLELTFTRRDYRTLDEVAGLATDANSLDPTFPTFNTTEYRAEAIDDPGGSPASLFFSSWASAALTFLSRTKILRYQGAKPTTMEVSVETRHTFESTVYGATQDLDWDFSLAASALDNDNNWGNIAFGAVSATWVSPQTGTYTFNVGTSLPSGAVQARINGGGWVTVITAGGLTGTLPGVTASDTIEIQHLSNTGTATETFLEALAPSGTVNAFAILLY